MQHLRGLLGALAIVVMITGMGGPSAELAAAVGPPLLPVATQTGYLQPVSQEGPKPGYADCGGIADLCAVYLPSVLKAPEALGTVVGRVVDATTVLGISGAIVCVPATGQCATTDGEGSYVIAGVPAGRRAVRASASGFIALQQGVTVPIEDTVTANFALSPDLAPGELRIVLTWGETPQDLDAHLWLPASTPYHIHFANKGDCLAFPDACLDVDDQTGDGPETVTIRQSYAGRYVFAVYNWSNEVPLAQSDGRVRVYGSDGLVAEISIPASGDGRWWHVFDLDGATGELTMHNAIQTTAPAPYVTEAEEIAK